MNTWDAFCGRLFDQNAFAIKLGLDNMRRAFVLEGHPERHAPAIVVGGTNGKGSTASALAAILTAHGLRTGLYTSPHLVEFRERFRVDGLPVSQAEVLAVGEPLLQQYGGSGKDPQLTFFELGTLMAAKIFARAAVDIAVWEVGLGGRLDAVNAIEPTLTVITSIDLDHQEYLGDTIAAVATEKAGLRRPGVPLVLAWQRHSVARSTFGFAETVLVPEGRHENVDAAREAAHCYLGSAYSAEAAARGLEAWRWPGRADLREVDGRVWLLDAAHNPAGARRLFDARGPNEKIAAVVIGAMKDKDLGGMFGDLHQWSAPVYAVNVASSRAASIAQLQAATPATPFVDTGVASEMFDAASKDEHGMIVVFGSVYLLGEWFEWAGIGSDELVTYRA